MEGGSACRLRPHVVENQRRRMGAWVVIPVSSEVVAMSRDKRQKRDLHALNDDGMVLCNPRDKEAAHRAEMEGIATEDRAAVTCRKCLALLFGSDRARMQDRP